ncbi:hypothetical protein BJ170DRAFT_623654 [Xylariales sp. AK1849]|nr:hypothetical protein BJ170DRAFT_623654 [Xylariales sp. AK1849]
MHDFKHCSGSPADKTLYWLHVAITAVGASMVVGGTFGVAVSIQEAYATGLISNVFDCADNSGTVS